MIARELRDAPARLIDYIPRHVLQEVVDALSDLLGLPMLIASWDGHPVTRSTVLSTFCYRFTYKAAVSRPCAHCSRFDDPESGNSAASTAQALTSNDCPSGLRDVVVPVVLGEHVSAYILTSQAAGSEDDRKHAHDVLTSLGMAPEEATRTVNQFASIDASKVEQIHRALASVVAVIASLALSYATNARLAICDALTGLHNRTYMWEFLSDKMSVTRASKKPFTLAVFDLDGFKEINDTYGHAAGDNVLQAVAGVINASIRPGDVAARYGGDEFLLILSETDLNQAKLIAARIAESIAELKIEQGDAVIRVKTSSGCASWTASASQTTPEQLFAQADRALYAAKADRKRAGAGHDEPMAAA